MYDVPWHHGSHHLIVQICISFLYITPFLFACMFIQQMYDYSHIYLVPTNWYPKMTDLKRNIYMQYQNPLPATTLVVWEVLRFTHVQMNLHLLNITNWWCCAREDRTIQIMTCIPRHFCLCKQVWQVKLSWNPPKS